MTDFITFLVILGFQIGAINSGNRPWMDDLGAGDMDVALLRQSASSSDMEA